MLGERGVEKECLVDFKGGRGGAQTSLPGLEGSAEVVLDVPAPPFLPHHYFMLWLEINAVEVDKR